MNPALEPQTNITPTLQPSKLQLPQNAMGKRIQWIYETFRPKTNRSNDYSILLEGMDWPCLDDVADQADWLGTVNQWAMIGLRPKTLIELKQNKLQQNSLSRKTFVETVSTVRDVELEAEEAIVVDPQTPEVFWNTLRQWLELSSKAPELTPNTAPKNVLPLINGFAGALGYGFTRWCDIALAELIPSPHHPDLIWCQFQDWILIHRRTGDVSIITPDSEREPVYREAIEKAVHLDFSSPETASLNLPALEDLVKTYAASFDADGFTQTVETLREEIRSGNLYQGNLSIRFQKQLSLLSPVLLYQAITARNPSPFSSVFQMPGGWILSNSPERLIKVNSHGKLETRPIAGTRGRGQSDAEDTAIGFKLKADTKEQAEHLMLVDLLRNDIGKVAEVGTVAVDELMVLERYSHVTHLVSNVIGQQRDDADLLEVLRALFPGGTITGCPKVRCVQTLENLEPVPRGFYTGSLGFIDPSSGQMDWNILIRTLFLEQVFLDQVESSAKSLEALPLVYNAAIHAGAGIVAQSIGPHEYRESLRKAAALMGVLHHVQPDPT